MKNRLENRKAISLVLLIIIVVIMLILATTVIVFVFRKSPIQNAKDVNKWYANHVRHAKWEI